MRTFVTITIAAAILLLAALLLVLGVTSIVRGIRGDYELQRNYLAFGIFVASVALLLGGAGATIVYAERRRRK